MAFDVAVELTDSGTPNTGDNIKLINIELVGIELVRIELFCTYYGTLSCRAGRGGC